jgi:hypothetical protein
MSPLSRSPDARLLRARQMSLQWDIYRGQQRSEDPLTYGYARFLSELRGLSYLEQERYFAMKPVLSGVYWLCTAAPDWTAAMRNPVAVFPQMNTVEPGVGAVLQKERSIIKALVLAEAPAEFIASQLDYLPEVVNTFEKLCWDIRAKMGARAWLHNHIFASGFQAEIAVLDFERLLLRQAYLYGINGVLDHLHLTGVLTDPKAFAKKVNERNIAEIAQKTATGIVSMPLTRGTAPELLHVAMGVDKAEKEIQLKDRAAQQGEGDPLAKVLLERVQTAFEGFQIADPKVPSEEGAEERYSDASYKQAVTTITKELEGSTL